MTEFHVVDVTGQVILGNAEPDEYDEKEKRRNREAEVNPASHIGVERQPRCHNVTYATQRQANGTDEKQHLNGEVEELTRLDVCVQTD